MIKLNPHTLIFIEEYIIFYSENLSLVRYNHFAARIEARKMTAVQPSIIKLVSPLMKQVMDDMSFSNTTDVVIKAVELTQRAFADQMAGAEKKQYAKNLMEGLIKQEDPEADTLDILIDLVVRLSKDRDMHKLFKKTSVFCLKCCGKD